MRRAGLQRHFRHADQRLCSRPPALHEHDLRRRDRSARRAQSARLCADGGRQRRTWLRGRAQGGAFSRRDGIDRRPGRADVPRARQRGAAGAVFDTLQSLGDTFTGTALLTLGLSLRARTRELRERRVAALCLLTSKFVLAPLLMRVFADLFTSPRADPATMDEHNAFAFVYGMLPSAPTVVVFAREYGERAGFLAALQLLCLLVTVPFLVVSTVAIESPSIGHSASLRWLVFWVAVGSTASGTAFVVAVVSRGAARLLTCPLPLWWLLGIGLSSLAVSGLDAVGCRGGDVVHHPSRLTRAAAGWALHCLRAQLACLAVLMAHQAHPRRSRHAQALDGHGGGFMRRWQAAGAVLSVCVPALGEAIGWLLEHGSQSWHAGMPSPHGPGGMHDEAAPSMPAPPSHDLPGERLCGGAASASLRVCHVLQDAVCVLLILGSLVVMWLAPADAPSLGVGHQHAEARPIPDDSGTQAALSQRAVEASGAGNEANGGGSNAPRRSPSPLMRRRVGIQPVDSLDSLP